MFCPRCGKEVLDNTSFCPDCGASLKQAVVVNKGNDTLRTVAFIFMIISTVILAMWTAFIALAWCIPMSVHLNNCIKEGRKTSIGFNICTLLFVNLISGILLLVASDQ